MGKYPDINSVDRWGISESGRRWLSVGWEWKRVGIGINEWTTSATHSSVILGRVN